MSSWAAPRAAFAQQLMGFGLGQLAQMEENKESDRRFQMAQQAEKDREDARRQWEKEMLNYRQELADKEVAQTFTDEEGRIIPVTQGEIRKGIARIPEAELRRQRASQEAEAAKLDLEQKNLRAQIGMRESAAERNRAQAEKARRPSESGSGSRSNADIAAARSYFNNLISEKDKDGKRVRTPAQAEEEVAARYGEEIAQAAFPNRANRIGPAAEMLGKVGQFASDVGSRAAKYLGLSLQ